MTVILYSLHWLGLLYLLKSQAHSCQHRFEVGLPILLTIQYTCATIRWIVAAAIHDARNQVVKTSRWKTSGPGIHPGSTSVSKLPRVNSRVNSLLLWKGGKARAREENQRKKVFLFVLRTRGFDHRRLEQDKFLHSETTSTYNYQYVRQKK